MKNLLPLLALITLTPLSTVSAQATPLPADCRYSDGTYVIQSIQHYLSEMDRFHQTYRFARSGSWEESRARESRDLSAQYAISQASPAHLAQLSFTQLDQLHQDMHSRYRFASSGSVAERTFRQVRDLTLTAFEEKGLENIQCLYGDVRNIDRHAESYHQLYRFAQSGSRIEKIYLRLRDAVYVRSESELRYQMSRMSGGELDLLEQHYHLECRMASSGSRKESHARTMRDLIRSEISRHGSARPLPPHPLPHPTPVPRPVPPPPPSVTCPPGTVYSPSVGRCVSTHSPRR